jgi:hypothetical protein
MNEATAPTLTEEGMPAVRFATALAQHEEGYILRQNLGLKTTEEISKWILHQIDVNRNQNLWGTREGIDRIPKVVALLILVAKERDEKIEDSLVRQLFHQSVLMFPTPAKKEE